MQTKVTMLPLPIFGCWKKRDGGKKNLGYTTQTFRKIHFVFTKVRDDADAGKNSQRRQWRNMQHPGGHAFELFTCLRTEWFWTCISLSWERGRFKLRGTSLFSQSSALSPVHNCWKHFCWTLQKSLVLLNTQSLRPFRRNRFHRRSHCSHTHKLLPSIPCICNTFCWLKTILQLPCNVWNDMRRPVIHFFSLRHLHFAIAHCLIEGKKQSLQQVQYTAPFFFSVLGYDMISGDKT